VLEPHRASKSFGIVHPLRRVPENARAPQRASHILDIVHSSRGVVGSRARLRQVSVDLVVVVLEAVLLAIETRLFYVAVMHQVSSVLADAHLLLNQLQLIGVERLAPYRGKQSGRSRGLVLH
jgi:hypothetical protein